MKKHRKQLKTMVAFNVRLKRQRACFFRALLMFVRIRPSQKLESCNIQQCNSKTNKLVRGGKLTIHRQYRFYIVLQYIARVVCSSICLYIYFFFYLCVYVLYVSEFTASPSSITLSMGMQKRMPCEFMRSFRRIYIYSMYNIN